mmetsp:Transcript_19417/g.37398  ORF Transcript_19417/g.37398 Transcript_19417/m.37398 type:complete len:95 (+) Transcript_19417:1384-1668(+)
MQGVDLERLSQSILQCQRDGPLPADWWQDHKAEVARGICVWLCGSCSHGAGGAQELHTLSLLIVPSTECSASRFSVPSKGYSIKTGQPMMLVHH